MPEPRGAGRSGGLLFLAVGVFVAYLVVRTVAGVFKVVLLSILVVLLVLLARDVLRRR
ncbi:MAG: hypothetical protein M3425_06590 [Actinomycetota bacterium]|jgi:hypothetical protein|nr:hypothetical protein [Euzebyales bacterium]MDQ3343005.1 hypothetical protein [Actinomycetota bacterium]MDQ3529602.1 hypothetical protein [Actinomycetota bacterium]